MELPMVEPAPVVTEHTAVFRDLCEHQCQCRHFQHDLTGRIVLPNQRRAHIARGLLESADKTHLSRCFSEAPWREAAVNRRRRRFLRQPTTPHRRRRRASLLAIDETVCEHVGSRFDDSDRHDNHRAGPDPWAHHSVTSCYGSGPVRCPVSWRLYRRDEERTPWEAVVAKPVPELQIPTARTARNRLHTQVDPVWRQEPECRARHAPLQTHIALAIAWVEAAIRSQVPLGVVVFDAWDLAEDVVQGLVRRRQDWISLLNTNRGLETASFHLREAPGWTLKWPGPHRAVEALVPLIPAHAYRPVTGGEHTSWGCTLGVRLPPGPGPERGQLCARVGDRTARRAGDHPRGLERREAHPPVFATLADGNV